MLQLNILVIMGNNVSELVKRGIHLLFFHAAHAEDILA